MPQGAANERAVERNPGSQQVMELSVLVVRFAGRQNDCFFYKSNVIIMNSSLSLAELSLLTWFSGVLK